ncbi:MAG: hypothetical protein KA230_07855, partial [Flavobacteriales bacterium]|nr:hypothetical protein [Flavobacteriales bacterium]
RLQPSSSSQSTRLPAASAHPTLTTNAPETSSYHWPDYRGSLHKGFMSIQRKWWWRWKKWVKVQPEGALQFLAYTVQDGQGNVLPL